jgi:hypothetical protein
MQRVTAELYAKMLDQAIETADLRDTRTGLNPEELRVRAASCGSVL